MTRWPSHRHRCPGWPSLPRLAITPPSHAIAAPAGHRCPGWPSLPRLASACHRCPGVTSHRHRCPGWPAHAIAAPAGHHTAIAAPAGQRMPRLASAGIGGPSLDPASGGAAPATPVVHPDPQRVLWRPQQKIEKIEKIEKMRPAISQRVYLTYAGEKPYIRYQGRLHGGSPAHLPPAFAFRGREL